MGEREARDASRAGDAAVAELEAFIAEAEARGESVPPEAHAMLARLRELVDALHGLSASLDEHSEEQPEERLEDPTAPGTSAEEDAP